MTDRPIIVLLRHDLRVADHPALAAAAATGAPVIPLFVLDDEAAGRWPLGGASRWWLHMSLTALSRSFASLGAPLVLRRGATCAIVTELGARTKAQAVYTSRAYLPWAMELEASLRDALDAAGVSFKRFAGTLLHDPDQVRTQAGDPFKVYSPFWRAFERTPPRLAKPAPERLYGWRDDVASDLLDDWQLLPTKPDWAGGLRDTWQPGEAGARDRLTTFLDRAAESYHEDRDRPDVEGTSRLSPHLAFGEISPVQCWHAATAHAERDPAARKGIEKFLKELGWREFSYHLLVHWPSLPETPFRQEFAAFAWDGSEAALAKWQRGQTGYPIVDAGMRELWHTGWMHNRVRMIVASFLAKDLRVPWQRGEAWFWDTLVDADLANNAASWQWVAGCGADAAPYFRIFNPVTQARKFDPDGSYIRSWVPELAELPDRFIHAPWEASAVELAAAGVSLGGSYPQPMVDHGIARQQALELYDRVKAG